MVAYFLVSLHKSSLPLHAEWSVLQRFYYKSECLKVLMTKVTKMPEILLSELPALYYGEGKKSQQFKKLSNVSFIPFLQLVSAFKATPSIPEATRKVSSSTAISPNATTGMLCPFSCN